MSKFSIAQTMSFHIKIACLKIIVQQKKFNYRQDLNDIVHRDLMSYKLWFWGQKWCLPF